MRDLNPVYISSKTQSNYPSGSTISYLDGRVYVMGDDAAEILVLNNTMDEIERISIFQRGEEARLPKASKADIEASIVLRRNDAVSILFLGSGSLSPHRDSAFRFNPKTREVKRMDMKEFYDQLRVEFDDLNIEAATTINHEMLIGIRANRSHPDNYLVLAGFSNNSYQFERKVKLQLAIAGAGISGLDYDEKRDILFITFSTEDTTNAFDDGDIGESYLAAVTNAKQVLKGDSLRIASVTALSHLHSEFKGQKIESVSLIGDKRKLLLVADDDRGNTKFFILHF